MTRTPPPRPHNVTRAGVAAALVLSFAGCGGEAVVATDPRPVAPAAPAYQPAPAAATAPREPRGPRRPAPAPAAPLVVRDVPAAPAAEPASPEPAIEPEPEPELVRDDAYMRSVWADLPAPVAPLPPPLEPLPEADVQGLRAELLAYLRRAAGNHRLPKERPEPGEPANVWGFAEQYWAFEGRYGKHKPELYGLMERDLWLAERLLEQDDPAVRRSGLGLVRWAIICAAQYVEDGRLAAAVAEVYLVPRLDSADPESDTFLSRESLLQSAVLAFETGRNWERMGLACGEIVRGLPRDRNQSDAWRTKLAVALKAQERDDEAVAVLEDVHDPDVTALRDHYLSTVPGADPDGSADPPEDAK